jgi:hypothetical protein
MRITAQLLQEGTLNGLPLKILDMNMSGLVIAPFSLPDERAFVSWDAADKVLKMGGRLYTKAGR